MTSNDFIQSRAATTKVKNVIAFAQGLFRRGFLRNVAILSGGATISQVISVLSLPILTRLYLPEDFGKYAVFVSFTSILTAVVSLQYEQVVVLPEKEDDASNLLLLALGIVSAISLVTMLGVAVVGHVFASLVSKEDDIIDWLWLMPISVFAIGIYQVFNFWLIRKKRFQQLSATRVIQSGITLLLQLTFGILPVNGLLQEGATGLIAGLVLGQLVAACILAFSVLHREGQRILANRDFTRMRRQAVQYKKYPLFSTWMFSLDRFQTSLPTLFFASFFGPVIAGYYSMTLRILYLPSNLVGRAISQVLFQSVAERNAKNGEVCSLIEKAFRWLCIVGVAYLFVIYLGSFFFRLVLGPEWGAVGQYARILAPSFALMLVVSTISFLPAALNKHEFEATWQLAALILTVLFLAVSYPFGSPRIVLIFLNANNVIVYMLFAFLIFRAARCSFRRALCAWSIVRQGETGTR